MKNYSKNFCLILFGLVIGHGITLLYAIQNQIVSNQNNWWNMINFNQNTRTNDNFPFESMINNYQIVYNQVQLFLFNAIEVILDSLQHPSFYLRQLGNFIFLVFVVNTSMYMIYYYILVTYNQKFRELEWGKKMYVLKNFSKATVLCYLTFYANKVIYDMLVLNIWNNEVMTLIGLIYASTDVSGLLFVPNLPLTTKIHHVMVSIIGIVTVLQDFEQPGIHGSFIGLAYFSIIPYLVNFLLGLRHLGFPRIRKRIAQFAGVIYGVCIFFNVLYQNVYTIWYSKAYPVTMVIYLLGYYFAILRDDLKLMDYLYRAATITLNQPSVMKCSAMLDSETISDFSKSDIAKEEITTENQATEDQATLIIKNTESEDEDKN